MLSLWSEFLILFWDFQQDFLSFLYINEQSMLEMKEEEDKEEEEKEEVL